jgi:hypothetical protein
LGQQAGTSGQGFLVRGVPVSMGKNGRIVHVLDIDQRFSTDTPVHPQAPLYHA